MLDDPKQIDAVQVTSQTLEELLGRRLVEDRGRLAFLYRIEGLVVRPTARYTPLEALHVESLAGEFEGADPALGLEPEKVAAIHWLVRVILASIVETLPPWPVAGTGGL